jgi:hypothetical protein
MARRALAIALVLVMTSVFGVASVCPSMCESELTTNTGVHAGMKSHSASDNTAPTLTGMKCCPKDGVSASAAECAAPSGSIAVALRSLDITPNSAPLAHTDARIPTSFQVLGSSPAPFFSLSPPAITPLRI